MEKLTETNIVKVHDFLKKENNYIKTGSLTAAITSIAGTSILSFFSFPYELLATTFVGATGIGFTVKFLLDKFRMEKTERELKTLSQRLESDFLLEQRFNNIMVKTIVIDKIVNDLKDDEKLNDLKDDEKLKI